MLARRVGEVEGRVADAGVDPQPDRQAIDARRRKRSSWPIELKITLSAMSLTAATSSAIPSDAVSVHLLAELLAAEPSLVQRAARRAVEVLGA